VHSKAGGRQTEQPTQPSWHCGTGPRDLLTARSAPGSSRRSSAQPKISWSLELASITGSTTAAQAAQQSALSRSAFLVTFWTDFSLLNAAARLVFSASRSERITPLLRDLHWLRVTERIRFRLRVLTFRCVNGTAPSYLADSICRVAGVEGRRHLRSSATATLIVRPVRRSTLGDRSFSVAAPRAGTVCRQPYGLHRRSPPSDENWKHFFFTRVFWTTSRQFAVSSYVISRYLIDCVKCPCSVLCNLNKYILIIIIIIITASVV